MSIPKSEGDALEIPLGVSTAALRFYTDYSMLVLFEFVEEVLGWPAPPGVFVDPNGVHPIDTYLDDETNRERAARGVSLAGHGSPECDRTGCRVVPGTLADLLHAPTGNLVGSMRIQNRNVGDPITGVTLERFADVLENGSRELTQLPFAHTVADMMIRGEIAALERRAGRSLEDSPPPPRRTIYLDLDPRLIGLGYAALQELMADDDRPSVGVDIPAQLPLCEVPARMKKHRREWTDVELLALGLAGFIPVLTPEWNDIEQALED